MSGAGTAVAASRAADQLIIDLESFQETWRTKPGLIALVLERNGLAVPDAPDFQFAMFEDGYGVLERKTGAGFNLMVLTR